MKEIVKLGAILLVFSALSALLLAFTYNVTLDPITKSREAADLQNRQQVFSEADAFEALSEDEMAGFKASTPDILEGYKAMKGSELIGHVFKVRTNGFGGAMEVVVGFDKEAKITGMRLGNHAETPGLGDNATKPEFYGQFPGLSLSKPLGVNKGTPGDNEIQAMSGATVTSKAVVEAVNKLKVVVEGLGK